MRRPVAGTQATPFGWERAREIWTHGKFMGEFRVTDGENAYVHCVWRCMGGETRWVDALLAIYNDRLPPGVAAQAGAPLPEGRARL